MTTKLSRVVVTFLGIITLLFGAAACGGGDSGVNKDALYGVWSVESVTPTDASADGAQETADAMMDLNMVMTLNADGGANINTIAMDSQDGTWTVEDNIVTVTMDGKPMEFTFADAKLTTTQDEFVMVFKSGL